MNRTADLSLEEFRRLPGVYRRWELPEVLKNHLVYRIEDAGAHQDGTPLLAIYAAFDGDDLSGTDEPVHTASVRSRAFRADARPAQ